NKFPGEAAVYMGIVHVAIYDAAVAIEGGYQPYTTVPSAAPGTSVQAAIASAAHDTLAGLQPQLRLKPTPQAILDADYRAYLGAIADDATAVANGLILGHDVAQAVLALRVNDGRGCSTTLSDLGLPAAAPGVWQPAAGPVLGLCLPAMRPLA